MIYNVVLVSGVQQSDIVIHKHMSILFQILSHIGDFCFVLFCFMAALGLCCCAQAFSICGEWGLLLVAVRGLLIAVASLVAEHDL